MSDYFEAKGHLTDLEIRLSQLEAHVMLSREYLERVHREVVNNLIFVYSSIFVMIITRWWFSLSENTLAFLVPFVLSGIFAVISCVRLAQARRGLARLDVRMLSPVEKSVLDDLTTQRQDLLKTLASRN